VREQWNSHPQLLGVKKASTNAQLEVTQMSKPEVAPKPVIIQQPTALAPSSQIWAGGVVILKPSEGRNNKGQIPTKL